MLFRHAIRISGYVLHKGVVEIIVVPIEFLSFI